MLKWKQTGYKTGYGLQSYFGKNRVYLEKTRRNFSRMLTELFLGDKITDN